MSNPDVKHLDASNLRFAVAVSRFNPEITDKLRDGAREALLQHGADAKNITEVSVPGAWELPLAAKAMAQSNRFDAIIALGCVIRGDTTHHLHVGGEAAHGLAQVSLEFSIPVAFGVLTTDSDEQAEQRAGGPHGNKGADAAVAAIEMVHLMKSLRNRPTP